MLANISLPSELHARHSWILRIRSDAPESTFEAFSGLFEDFAKLGNGGAFIAAGADDSNCSMSIAEQFQQGHDTLQFLVNVMHCDPRYARPLRNAVFALSEMLDSAVVEFRIEPADRSSGKIRLTADVDPDEVSSGRFYPELSTRIGVQLQRDLPANHRSGRRVWLRCVDKLSVQLLTDLNELTILWASVLAHGYPSTEQELREGETMILNVEGSQHDDLTFEVLVDLFIASEAAFASLVNVLVFRVNRENRTSTAGLE